MKKVNSLIKWKLKVNHHQKIMIKINNLLLWNKKIVLKRIPWIVRLVVMLNKIIKILIIKLITLSLIIKYASKTHKIFNWMIKSSIITIISYNRPQIEGSIKIYEN